MKCNTCMLAVLFLSLAGTVMADTVSFSTDFSGTTLDSALTPAGPAGTQQALDGVGGLKIFTSPDNVPRNSDIWATSIDGMRVTYGIDPTDTRGFTMETVVSNWVQSGGFSEAGMLMVFSNASVSNTALMMGIATDSKSGASIVSQADVLPSTSWGCADVALGSISGTGVNVGLKVVKDDSGYAFSYRLGNSSSWEALNTIDGSVGTLQYVGLFGKTYGGSSISNATFDSMSFTVVPEPSTLTLGLAGLVGLLAYAWRKQK